MDYLQLSMLLSLERLMYGFVWKSPRTFSSFAGLFGMQGQEPEFIFSLVRVFKFIQVYVFSTWYYAHFGTSLPNITFNQLALGLPILLFGQFLNFMVWYRIGINGVCYGCKFGRNIPWCTKFPYNVFSHPQYYGAILTVWGMFIFSSGDYPKEWFILPVVETLLYVCSILSLEA